MTHQRLKSTDVDSILPAQPEWLRSGLVMLAYHGSHAYGTATETSDVDLKGIAIPPFEYFLGFHKRFEQAITSAPYDMVIYDLRKFMHLAADCNPNIIELLWVDESDIVYETVVSEKLRANRHLFLSQKAKHTFSGYAISQLKRIKTHRRWLLSPPTRQPTREEFGLPADRKLLAADQIGACEAEIQKVIDGWNLDLSDLDDARRIYIQGQLERIILERTTTPDDEQAAKLIGFDDNMLVYLDKERKYKAALAEWNQYLNWKATRNPIRAELEAKYGLDCKHAAHLVRLLRMCREILTEGVVHVKRSDAEELLAIRNGAWSYEQLVEFAEREDVDLYEVMKASKLPKTPPIADLDALCMELVRYWAD